MKEMLFSSVAALAVAFAGGVAADQHGGAPFVSGDTPMNVGQEAQIKQPTSNAAEQAATERMLEGQGEMLTGDVPVDQGAAGQIKAPTPNAAEQAVTAEDLKKEDSTGAISGKYE